ncbi:hypothetical protein A616_16895 [Brevibacillus brevis X23]|nr:hypothetical protein A616_16895 [Brevibacillus brevis X23]
MDKPSKYHRWVYTGGEIERKWIWDSSHEELEPTSTFKIEGGQYCSYCYNQAYPIQSGLRNRMEDYTVTGYCCICDAAEKEKEYRNEKAVMSKRHRQEEQELILKYANELKPNKKKRLEMLHRYEIKQLERNERLFEFRKQ